MSDNFQANFEIGGRSVGQGHPILIIAEAGVAHFGDMDLARQLVDMAADGGADVFKTQFFDVEALISKRAADWRSRLRPRNLTLDQARELKTQCEERGLAFAATAHDETRIPWLVELDVPVVKVGSGERNNPEFITKLARLGKPMILSTGMYRESDVLEAMNACQEGGCQRLVLLHCVTSYPTPDDQVNLRRLDRLKEIFPGPVGYSDHTEDDAAVSAAVARGATVVEKHITIMRDIPDAQDWRVSADPETLPQLVSDIRRVEALLGHNRIEPASCEEGGLLWALKSLVTVSDLPAGHALRPQDLVAKRPGDGLPPNRLGEVIGRRLKVPLSADSALAMEDLV